MLIVFLILGTIEILQGMLSAPSGRAIAYRIGVGMADAIISIVPLAVLILLVGGAYYVFAALGDGVPFRKAIFNWPMVILASCIAILILLR